VAVGLVAAIDALDRAGVPAVGYANYLLVFGIAHQLGYLWAEGRLPTGARALPLAGAGLAGAIALVSGAGYPLSMVGLQADADSNATPPTLALLALGVAQLGVVLALRRPAERMLLRRPVLWAGIAALGTVIITVFLWHMTALVVVAALTHLTGWWPTMTAIDGQWWALRPVWLVLCTVALAPLVLALRTFEGGGEPAPGGPWRTTLGWSPRPAGSGSSSCRGCTTRTVCWGCRSPRCCCWGPVCCCSASTAPAAGARERPRAHGGIGGRGRTDLPERTCDLLPRKGGTTPETRSRQTTGGAPWSPSHA
jgi:hypothetical protein